MPNNFRISISHNKGTHFISVSKKTRNIVLSSVVTIILSLILTSIAVKHFYFKSTISSQEISELVDDQQKLLGRLQEKNLNRNELIKQLEQKQTELLVLEQRVHDVESVLGINQNEQETSLSSPFTLEKRIDTAVIDSSVRSTMFRLIPNGIPLDFSRYSSKFGRRTNPISKKRHNHLGIDLTCKRGTEIFSPADGVIEYVRPSKKGYGNLLKVQHSFGFMTMYAHLQGFNVKMGQFVKKGDLIAKCGNSGDSTGSHLHYEVRFLRRAINPQPFMDWTPDKFELLFEKERSIKWQPLVEVFSNLVTIQVQLTQIPTIKFNTTMQLPDDGTIVANND
ncbi:MAG: peptidoglycan DD-metalloendopeptidase family protein [Aliivibrio sp.]|uniref:M23 family metallopeptidase n=1 Tax=Aliivibrio sp. TaxID=1872443 RepID=UPI001A41807F|nr:peptidoglycan DD-metalloendopeptidase family protein [Aliivibrio sp.]